MSMDVSKETSGQASGQEQDRNQKGQFAPGHKGAGGRPSKAREIAILQVGREVATLDRWREIFEKAVDDAIKDEDGRTRDRARRFLAEYFIGKPAQTIKVRSDDSGDLDEYAGLTDDELRAIAYGITDAGDASHDSDGVGDETETHPGDRAEGAG